MIRPLAPVWEVVEGVVVVVVHGNALTGGGMMGRCTATR